MAKFRTRRRRGVVLSRKQRATHLWVIGQPGTGKSRAIESWVMTDIKAGRGVGVFDPHSDYSTTCCCVRPLWLRMTLPWRSGW